MSIRRQLLRWLLGTLLIAGIAAASLTFVLARDEIDELLDAQLRQLAFAYDVSGAPQLRLPPPGHDSDPEDRYAALVRNADGDVIFSSPDAPHLPAVALEGFANVTVSSGSWRMYTHRQGGRTLQMAQRSIVRDKIAIASALNASLPVFLLVPLLGALVFWAISRSLRGLNTTIAAVSNRDADNLAPLPLDGIPTELAPLVEEMNALLARLGEAIEAQRRFVSDAAHELRTPLAALRLQSYNLESAKDEDDRKNRLDALRTGIRRASELVDQLLRMARQEARRGDVLRERVELGGLLRECLAELAPLAVRKGVDLGLFVKGENEVFGDREALRILVANLVENALRHTPGGGVVDVRLSEDPNVLARIEIADSGPGIPEELLERVFDRFYRMEGSSTEGSGLGLSLVRRIAERHGARVRLANGKNGGLLAVVEFPRQSVPSSSGQK